MIKPLYWITQNLCDVPESDDWLSSGERDIFARMRFPKRRKDWRLGRWTAKQAVCAYRMNEDPVLSSLEIRAASDGAPEAFWTGGSVNAAISISHSGGRCLCAVGPPDFALGCDLESIEPREDGLIRDFFTPEEISFSRQAADGAGIDLAVNLIWSAKEASLKVLREGLRRDTRSISISADFGKELGGWKAWRGLCTESSRDFWGWWRTCEQFVYTLASDRPTPSPRQLPRKQRSARR